MFSTIQNYIYLFHTDTVIILPVSPESISDRLESTFAAETPLSRTAPIYSYSNSGPRTVQFDFKLHREMFNSENSANQSLKDVTPEDDTFDTFIGQLQSIALPVYSNNPSNMITPPMVAVKLGNTIFVKGVVVGGINVTYNLPLLENGKYAVAEFSFSVSEVDPYDASSIVKFGSFRGLSSTVNNRVGNLK